MLLRHISLALRHVFRAALLAPLEATFLVVLLAASGLVPVGVLSLTRTLVDGLALELGIGAFTLKLLWPLLGLALLFAVDFLLVPWVAYL